MGSELEYCSAQTWGLGGIPLAWLLILTYNVTTQSDQSIKPQYLRILVTPILGTPGAQESLEMRPCSPILLRIISLLI